jgi:hypothetical protein
MINIFPGRKLRGLVTNFHIHLTVSDLYFSMIGLTILLQQNRGTVVEIYKSLTDIVHECSNWERGCEVSFLGIFVLNFRYSDFAK